MGHVDNYLFFPFTHRSLHFVPPLSVNLFHLLFFYFQCVFAFLASSTWRELKKKLRDSPFYQFMVSSPTSTESQKMNEEAFKKWFGVIVYSKCIMLFDAWRQRRRNAFRPQSAKEAKVLKHRLRQRKISVSPLMLAIDYSYLTI